MNGGHEGKCWICGNPADSGEHLIKASMLRHMFPNVTQKTPAFSHGWRRKNEPLRSTNAKNLKLTVLCQGCNNMRTQPFDRAWDVFWQYLQGNKASLGTGCLIRRDRLFPTDASAGMLNLHLYAVKLFGCVASYLRIPVDLVGMADAIKYRRPYPNVLLGAGRRAGELLPIARAGLSDVWCACDDTYHSVFAVWFLLAGDWQFQFTYAAPGQERDGMIDCWNPITSKHPRAIRLKVF